MLFMEPTDALAIAVVFASETLSSSCLLEAYDGLVAGLGLI